MSIYRRLQDGREFRHRSRATLDLPRLSAAAEPDLAFACFDKMELKREFLLRGFEHRAAMAAELKQMLQEMGITLSGRPLPDGIVFRGRGNLYNAASVVMRAARPEIIPLCDNLQLTFWDWGRTPGAFKIRASLKLNPSRIAAHARQRGLNIQNADWTELLFSDEATRRSLSDESLDGQDNLLPSSRLEVLDEGPGITGTLQCLDAVDRLLIYLLAPSVDAEGEAPRGILDYFSPVQETTRDWAVSQAEVYWEFGEGEATDRLISLRGVVWAMGQDVAETAYPPNASLGGFAREGHGYSCRLNRTTRLSIYSKAEDRVRVEIAYDKSPPVGTAHLPLHVRLENLLADAQRRARRVISPIYRFLQREGAVRPNHTQFIDRMCELTQRLASFYPDPAFYQRMLRTLLLTGGVSAGPEAVITVQEAQRLVAAGILTRDRVAHPSRTGANRFALHANYLGLFERIYELEAGEGEAS